MVDCSFVAALALPDECSPKVRAFFATAPKVLFAPLLLRYELANVLSVAVRRRRMSHAQAEAALNLFERLGIRTDARSEEQLAHDLFATAQAYDLSAYDAAYLELALRENAALATADAQLATAAKRAGLATIL